MSKALCDAVSQKSTVSQQDYIKTISSTILSLVQHENQLTSNSKVLMVLIMSLHSIF